MKINDKMIYGITLNFFQKNLEKDFHEFYINKYLWQLRLAHIFSAIFYLIAVLSEIYLLKKSNVFLWLRLGVIMPSFVIGYVISYIVKEFYKKYYQYFNIYYVLITALSFIFTGKYAPFPYSVVFYSGIIICLLFNFAFIRQSFIKSSFTGFIILAVYLTVIAVSTNKSDYLLLSVYISVSYILGMIIAYLTEYENKRSYLLQLQTQKYTAELSNINSVLEKEVEKRTFEIQNANKILEENEARLVDANKLAGLGYWIWDIESGNVQWSDEVYKIFGLEKNSFTPQIDSIMKLSPWPEDNKRNQELISRATENREKGEYEQKFLKPDRTTGYYRSTFIGSYNEQGKLTTIKGTIIDITKVKEIELDLINKNNEYEALNEELRQINEELLNAKENAEESNRLKDEFLHNMSHEIRTPMNGIIGFTEMLTSAEISKEQRDYYIQIIQNSSFQLLKIIDDILEISSLETKQTTLNEESFCLNDLIMEIFSIFDKKSREQNIPLFVKKELEDNQSYIVSDRNKITKILIHLLENAYKFTIDGFIEMGYYLENNNLVLYIKDTGIGILNENMQMIFTRFSQENKELSKKSGGLGLGLSISKENAQILGGDIKIDSEKGKGSTFYLVIPYKKSNDRKPDKSKTNLTTEKKGDNSLTILIAEDEEINYLYIEALLKSQTDFVCNLLHAKNGKEAVEICLENKNIDIVLMDIKMPFMDGYKATELIKSSIPRMPVIAQTAYSTESEKEISLQHGCNDFISKPINKEKLFELINKYHKIH